MIDNYIKHFLSQKKSLSLESLEKILKEKRKNKDTSRLKNKSNLFKINDKTVFVKSALMRYKEDFLNEFDDFLDTKAINKTLKKNLLGCYSYSIPDILFAEWIETTLDKKLIIFELLYNLLLKPKRIKDRTKIFLNELTEIYAYTVIYSTIIIQNNESDYEHSSKFLKKTEKYEAVLKDFLFTLLVHPEKIKNNIEFYETSLTGTKSKLEEIFNHTFQPVNKYSGNLVKRIINNDFKNFNFLKLITRFNFNLFYEWLHFLIDEENEPHNNLFKDLML